MTGLILHCPGAECACVVDELDTCTVGEVWSNATEISWQDPRWNTCIKIEHRSPLRARAILRWWHNKCMGHAVVNLDIGLESISREMYVDFNVLAYFEHDTIHNTYRVQTMSGSEDERPMAGSSNMFFEARLEGNPTGVHVEITDCVVQVIEGTSINASIMNEYNVFNGSTLSSIENGMRMTYQAFWDEDTNSPYQRLVCKYSLYNGTASQYLLHNTVNRTYMMADPNENGILINEPDAMINARL